MNLKVKSKKINDFTYELAISAKWIDIKEDFNSAKKKVAKPHYWILNSIDEYDAAEDKQPALLAMAQIVFNTNNYSEKLVSENENIEAKTELNLYKKTINEKIETIIK